MKIDLESIRQNALQADHVKVVNLLVELMKVAMPLSQDATIGKQLTRILTDLGSDQTKSPPRKRIKVPPKKKAPPPKTKLTQQPLYYSLFWLPTNGGPPRVGQASVTVIKQVAETYLAGMACSYEPILHAEVVPSSSIYDNQLTTAHNDVIGAALNDARVDQWFKRAPKKNKPEISHVKPSKRPCALVPAVSQRIGVLLYSLKKSLSPKAQLTDVKQAMLSCTINKDCITLLTDTIPDPEDPAQQRKLEDWKDSAIAVKQMVEESPETPLYDEEDFVWFISEIPAMHKRLACMFVTTSLPSIVGALEHKMSLVTSALERLVSLSSIHVLWKILLHLGNRLNQGTARGDQQWFRLSGLRRALDVRGTDGITIPEYCEGFVGPVLSDADWRVIMKAKEAGVLSTYAGCKSLLETLATVLGTVESNLDLPDNLPGEKVARFVGKAFEDQFRDVVREKALGELDRIRDFGRNFVRFLKSYIDAIYFFGVPDELLPLDDCSYPSSGADDGEEGKDLFFRIAGFIEHTRSAHQKRIKGGGNQIKLQIEDWVPVPISNRLATTSTPSSPRSRTTYEVPQHASCPQIRELAPPRIDLPSDNRLSETSIGNSVDKENRFDAPPPAPLGKPQIIEQPSAAKPPLIAPPPRAPLRPFVFKHNTRLNFRLPAKAPRRQARSSINACYDLAREAEPH